MNGRIKKSNTPRNPGVINRPDKNLRFLVCFDTFLESFFVTLFAFFDRAPGELCFVLRKSLTSLSSIFSIRIRWLARAAVLPGLRITVAYSRPYTLYHILNRFHLKIL